MKLYIRAILNIFLLTSIFLVACQQKSSAEKAGERVDDIVDNVKHGETPLKNKGPVEKLAESIEDSVPDKKIQKKAD